MPGFLYHSAVQAMCVHGGQITAVASSSRVLLSGQPATTVADSYPVAGCAFNIAGAPHPCVKAQWLVPAGRVRIGGQPAVLQTSPGLTVAADQAPQGSPVVMAGQTRVQAI